jgi:hypothetical protein
MSKALKAQIEPWTLKTEAWRLKMELWRVFRPVQWSQIPITLMRSSIRIRIKVKCRIRIRIEVKI